jgi:hypothetical protein
MKVEKPATSRTFALVHLVLALQLLVIMFFCARPASDPDYGWHIANGRHVFDGGTFSGHDIYSWTSTSTWVAHEWLTEAVMYIVHAWSGASGNSILFAILGVITYAILAVQLRRRFGWTISLIVLPISFLGSMRSIGVRPLMLELLYLSLLLALVDAYVAGPLSRRKLFAIAFAGAVLWANTHGSFLLMPGVFGITAVEMWLARDRRWSQLIIAAFISALSPLANPWGWGLFGFATQSITSPTTLARIQEWQAPLLNETLAIPFLLQLALAAIGICGLLLRMSRGKKAEGNYPATLGMLRAIVFAFLALKSGRHMVLFGLAAAPMMGAALSLVLRRSSQTSGDSSLSINDHRRSIVNLAAAALMAIGITRAAWKEISPSAQRAAIVTRYPVGLASHLSTAMSPSDRLLNEYGWGGFLIQRNILPVFIDGRSEVYGDAQLERYASIIHLEPGWRETIDRLGVNLVLMPRKAPLAVALERNGWSVVARDSVGTLLKKPVD